MKKVLFNILLFFNLMILVSGAVQVTQDTIIPVQGVNIFGVSIEQPEFNFTTLNVTSASIWDTISLGSLNDANDTQHLATNGVLNIDESYLDTFGNGIWLTRSGDNANQNIDIATFDISTLGVFFSNGLYINNTEDADFAIISTPVEGLTDVGIGHQFISSQGKAITTGGVVIGNIGGEITANSGQGGDVSGASIIGIAGVGGKLSFAAGNGGISTNTAAGNVGGVGGAFELISGAGMAISTTNTAANTAGAGGQFLMQSGDGGSASNSASNTAAAGGTFFINGGDGGSANTTNANGAAILITTGGGGSDAAGSSSDGGLLQFDTGGGAVGGDDGIITFMINTNKIIEILADQTGMQMVEDNGTIFWGASKDAACYFDGVNFVCDPDNVGAGRFLIGATGDDGMHLFDLEVQNISNGGENIDVNDEVNFNQQIDMTGNNIQGLNDLIWSANNHMITPSAQSLKFEIDDVLIIDLTDLGINITNKSLYDLRCLNFSNGDTICGNSSIDITINGTRTAVFSQNQTNLSNAVIIDSGSDQVYPLDLIGLDPTATDGLQIRMGNVVTNATTKLFGMSGRHFNNEEMDISILVGQSTAGGTIYFWGGGSVNFNAATMQRFYASSSNTVNSNTEILRLENTVATIFTDLNITNNSLIEIQCLNFSNGDTICGNASIDITINGTSLAKFAINNTQFIGDVENVHDVNNFSRFFEKNSNSGNFATSVFSAENDINFSVHLGITSSGFDNGNSDILSNQGFLFFQTTNTTLFANGFNTGFKWINNLASTQLFTATDNDLMTLSPDGSLNVSSNITASNLTIREFIGFTHQTTPGPITGQTQMYCKSNNRCFIMKDDGTERRLLDGGGGSFTVDEEIYFENVTTFSYLNGTFTGGSAHVCIYNNGTLFTSEGACP